MTRKTKTRISLILFVVLLAFHVTTTNSYDGQYDPGDMSNIDFGLTMLGTGTVLAFLWMVHNLIKSYDEKPYSIKDEEQDHHLGI